MLLRHASLKTLALSYTHRLEIILNITFPTVGALTIIIKSLSIDIEIKKDHYTHHIHFQSHIPLLSQSQKERGRVMKQGVGKGERLQANQEGTVGNRTRRGCAATRPKPHHQRDSIRRDHTAAELLITLVSKKDMAISPSGIHLVSLHRMRTAAR